MLYLYSGTYFSSNVFFLITPASDFDQIGSDVCQQQQIRRLFGK